MGEAIGPHHTPWPTCAPADATVQHRGLDTRAIGLSNEGLPAGFELGHNHEESKPILQDLQVGESVPHQLAGEFPPGAAPRVGRDAFHRGTIMHSAQEEREDAPAHRARVPKSSEHPFSEIGMRVGQWVLSHASPAAFSRLLLECGTSVAS